MRLTRRNKNRVLVAANLLLVPVVTLRLMTAPASVSTGLIMWFVATPPVVVLAIVAESVAGLRTLAHPALFLLTGAALGLTGAAILERGDDPWVIGLAWLPFGLAAAVLHYLPGPVDDRD